MQKKKTRTKNKTICQKIFVIALQDATAKWWTFTV